MVGELCKNSCLQQFRIIHPVKKYRSIFLRCQGRRAARNRRRHSCCSSVWGAAATRDPSSMRHGSPRRPIPGLVRRPLPRSTSGRRKVTQPECERQGGPRPPVPPRAQRLIRRRLQPARGRPPPSAGWDRHRRERRGSMEQRVRTRFWELLRQPYTPVR
jgi:hypothetical protein